MMERNLGYTALTTNGGSTTTTSPGHIAMTMPAGSTTATEGLEIEAEGTAQAPEREDGLGRLVMDDVDVIDEEAGRATADLRKTAPCPTVFRCPRRKKLV